jgi:8-oxo-dGTP pyrophosphatase MutT (NUDIX family)
MDADLPSLMAARLQHPLPGWPAQARFQPELSFGRHRGPAPAAARRAAVLILLYPRAGQWHLPLIVRPSHMPDHAGQVSFPGGMIEPDEDSRQAALREYSEELGASGHDVEVLGQLSELYLYASNFHVYPWVGAVREAPNFRPSALEVERLLEIPLRHFFDPANTGMIERRHRGLSFSAPCYSWEGESIWGATSMILSEFLAALPAGVW